MTANPTPLLWAFPQRRRVLLIAAIVVGLAVLALTARALSTEEAPLSILGPDNPASPSSIGDASSSTETGALGPRAATGADQEAPAPLSDSFGEPADSNARMSDGANPGLLGPRN
jgi:hypothetical protein